jgi:hypothetical protein
VGNMAAESSLRSRPSLNIPSSFFGTPLFESGVEFQAVGQRVINRDYTHQGLALGT